MIECEKCQDQAWIIVEVDKNESMAIICDCPRGQVVKEGLKMKKDLLRKKLTRRFLKNNTPDFKKAAADDREVPF